jgi:ferritin
MLGDRMTKALNKQVNAELYSSYLYLSMSSYFRRTGLIGCARWMEVQALEELTHAMKFFHFINERGKQTILEAVENPPTHWDSPLAAFEDVYGHEVKVTSLIHGLVDLALEERDHATNNFLQWFVSEQVEEEASADDVVQKMRLIRDNQSSLFLLDQELGQRQFAVPPGTTIVAGAGGKTN